MGGRFKPVNRRQAFLLPPSMLEWLPPGDLAYFVIELVDELDLSEIVAYYERRETDAGVRSKASSGQPAFHPKMMTALLLYAYGLGTPSSRRIATLIERDAGYRVVAANQTPDFRTISEFRRVHLKALRGLFVQVLRLAREAGLVKLGHVSLDGTKVKANASKHKAMSYAYMVKKEQELQAEVDDLLRRAEEIDAREDGLYGPDRRGDELPEELKFRERRLAKIREAKAALEAEAKAKARAEGKLDDEDRPKPTKGRQPQTPPGAPEPKAQRNFTDPDSKIMKMGHGTFDQAYNCQAVVDSTAQIIVAGDVTNAANDKRQVQPMMEQVKENLGAAPRQASADSGYYSEENVGYLREQGIDDYVCPDRQKHGEKAVAARGPLPRDATFLERVRRKLTTQRGREIYGRRKGIVEPVFGQMKQARGLRQFLLRGREKVQSEWSLWTTTHNLLKLWAAATV